jgi:hypothetical protein
MRALGPALVALIVIASLGIWFVFREPRDRAEEREPPSRSDEPLSREDRSALSGAVARLLTDETIAAVEDLRSDITSLRSGVEKTQDDGAAREKRLDARFADLERSIADLLLAIEISRTRMRIGEILSDAKERERDLAPDPDDAAREAKAAQAIRQGAVLAELDRIQTLKELESFRRKYPEIR